MRALSLVDMMDSLVTLTKTKKVSPGSIDDITLVGLEIMSGRTPRG